MLLLIHVYLSFHQLENLESILGGLRGSGSEFYPEQVGAGRANEGGNKAQGCLDDNLQGRTGHIKQHTHKHKKKKNVLALAAK